MGVPTSEVGYTSATAGRGDHEVRDGHVVALENNRLPDDGLLIGLEHVVTQYSED
jgi:hypothetical protein